jgi:uncharacterized membrane protein YeaQ/YmgE (transglycosylase-associated protein family)
MSFLAWIVLGLIAGWIASMIVNKSGEGVLLDIVLGVIGRCWGDGSSTRSVTPA